MTGSTHHCADGELGTTLPALLALSSAPEGYTRLFEPGFHRFLDLPREIRDLIYEEYIKLEQSYELHCRQSKTKHLFNACKYSWPGFAIQYDAGTNVFMPKWAPRIFGTSHQVRGEVAYVIFVRAWWVQLGSAFEADHFTKFLETLHLEKPFEVVRFLLLPKIHHFNRTTEDAVYGGNSYMQLVFPCTELRRIHLTFHASTVCKEGVPHPYYTAIVACLRASMRCSTTSSYDPF